MIDHNRPQKYLSIYLTHGLYDESTTLQMVQKLLNNGVDFIELGMPYSDPLADGPVIQEASSKALKKGAELKGYFKMAKHIIDLGMPVVFMGYFNQLLQRGESDFFVECQQVGIQHLIVPDLPLEVVEREYQQQLDHFGLNLIYLVCPTTSDARLKHLDQACTSFIYVVSDNKITGSTGDAHVNQKEYLGKIQREVQSPTMLGFGIHNAESASLSSYTAGVIVGSAFLKRWMLDAQGEFVEDFLGDIKRGL